MKKPRFTFEESADHAPTSCTNCGYRVDSGTQVRDSTKDPIAVPMPGSITICLNCSHIMVYGDDMQLRNPEGREFYELAGDPRIIRAQKVLQRMRQEYERQTGRPWIASRWKERMARDAAQRAKRR